MLSDAQKALAIEAYKGARPKFHKGKYGRKFDSYSCGHCGAGLKDIVDNFCFKCGFRILWDSPRCLTKNEEQNTQKQADDAKIEWQIDIFDFIGGESLK